MNPYVESTFADWRKNHRLAANASRQAAPLPLLGARVSPALAGTSSFGMSGVNAHALLETAEAQQTPEAEPLALSRQQHWALVPALYFAERAAPASSRRPGLCSFAVNLARAELAYLWDHQVTATCTDFGLALMLMWHLALFLVSFCAGCVLT